METKHLDALYDYTMQDPELHQFFLERAAHNADRIIGHIMQDSQQANAGIKMTSAKPSKRKPGRKTKISRSEIRERIMDLFKKQDELTVTQMKEKHHDLSDLTAAVLYQCLDHLRREKKVKLTKKIVGRAKVWRRS